MAICQAAYVDDIDVAVVDASFILMACCTVHLLGSLAKRLVTHSLAMHDFFPRRYQLPILSPSLQSAR